MKIFVILSILTQSACSMFGIRSEETPNYTILLQEDNKELRSYSSYIVAKTKVQGDYQQAQREGFKILASYIFGENKKAADISMTAPVLQESKSQSEQISMTAPVSLSQEADAWIVAFMMPSKYQLSELPTPNDARIVLEEMPPRIVASLRFTGGRGAQRNTEKSDELRKWIETKPSYTISSVPISAGYDPPWTLPFLRKNEVHFELDPKIME